MGHVRVRLSAAALAGLTLAGSPFPAREARSSPPAEAPVDLDVIRRLSLEELMSLDVTTIAGLPEEWFRTPAAMTVITGEDLRRSGHRSLPEALRLVPGMFVGHVASQSWRLGARGFTGAALPTPRNLVLIDGRSVYDPLYGGVNWDVQDVLFDDIDRIEVIRGPGATLWGPNAVSGVINVITKSAPDTHGTSISGGSGTYERGFSSIRHGTRVNEGTWIRVYGKHFARDRFGAPPGRIATDDWSMLRSGFRLDADGPTGTRLTLQGDVYDSPGLGSTSRLPKEDAHLEFETRTGEYQVGGGNLLARWMKDGGPQGRWTFQAYYDRTTRTVLDGFEVERSTVDLDVRHDRLWHPRHQLVWGLGLRRTTDESGPGRIIQLEPGGRSLGLASGFVQQTSALVPEKLQLMLGTKLTDYTITGLELQPSVRLWWTPDDRQTAWCALSRSVRHPTRLELDGRFILAYADSGLSAGGAASGVYLPVTLDGDPGLGSERQLAWELGYRLRPRDGIVVDVALYRNEYSRLISVPPGTVGRFNDEGSGHSQGVELAAAWRPAPTWRLQGAYSYTEVQQRGPVLRLEEQYNAKHLAHLLSSLEVSDRLELNAAAYHAGRVPLLSVPSYLRLDAGATWRAGRGLYVSLWGQNLLDPGIQELSVYEFPRGMYLQGSVVF